MRPKIMKCKKCGIYTMKSICKICGRETAEAVPPRFSPQDRYGEYRRKLKLKVFTDSGDL